MFAEANRFAAELAERLRDTAAPTECGKHAPTRARKTSMRHWTCCSVKAATRIDAGLLVATFAGSVERPASGLSPRSTCCQPRSNPIMGFAADANGGGRSR